MAHTIPTLDEQLVAFRARTSSTRLFAANPVARESNLSRLHRQDEGDVSDRCFWCGAVYVNVGCFPYCGMECAACAEVDR